MKKFLFLLTIAGLLLFTLQSGHVLAQDGADTTVTEQAVEAAPAAETSSSDDNEMSAAAADAVPVDESGHQVIMRWFIDGGPTFMSFVLICLILGLAFAIERIITLGLASTNVKKLLGKVEDNLASGNVDAAKELCKSNRSPIASIMFQGLDRAKEGIDVVEKSVVAYGSVQMGLLERGLVWISLFIALAPMLGFMGTVIGMVNAFDAIEAAGDINPRVVAGGIKVALLTTLFGLIVAVILQIFYNYIVARIDGIVNDMEDASISFVDMLIKHKIVS